ncbi:Chalcone--flavonone isomerase [Hibiscus syriacus]|uniref:Chalcone-flavonone isomerase family protein n=1 Tax=Hibiscus syriacus TaxID=106335 RepID=A0A6A3AFQ5_HIBSY|nr:chalcone--flavonone isomerase-like [Hibiscus syriacus]KAE8702567.1 Chalcone--flavonone isomerase [Hibiscus syriacus]
MSTSASITELEVENVAFPPKVKPPGSRNTLFLGGAGDRGLDIHGTFIKITAIGVYLEDKAVDCLAGMWKGKNAADLADSVEFFRDIITGDFEKFVQVTTIMPITGQQYSERVAEQCVAILRSHGTYADAETKAIEKIMAAFKYETFLPGSSILFTISPRGSLTIGFMKDRLVPENGKAVIENKDLGNAVLESIIGKNGVSPAVKRSLASRLSQLFRENLM